MEILELSKEKETQFNREKHMKIMSKNIDRNYPAICGGNPRDWLEKDFRL